MHGTRKILLGLTAIICNATALGAAPHPDFTGIWDPVPGSRESRAQEREGFVDTAPFTPAARKRVLEYQGLVKPTDLNPGAYCVSHGMPAAMLGTVAYPLEIIQRPEQITMIHELHAEIRRIYTDGRKVDPADLVPERSGYSTGRWEGDTLVVETISLVESIDQFSAHSDNAKITERYRLGVENGMRTLFGEISMTDSFYTKPISFTRKWKPSKSARILSYDCNEPVWEKRLDELRAERDAKGNKQ